MGMCPSGHPPMCYQVIVSLLYIFAAVFLTLMYGSVWGRLFVWPSFGRTSFDLPTIWDSFACTSYCDFILRISVYCVLYLVCFLYLGGVFACACYMYQGFF